jgi:hypothetical protein
MARFPEAIYARDHNPLANRAVVENLGSGKKVPPILPSLLSLSNLRQVQLRRYVKNRLEADTEFTIIGDDCWAGRMYAELGLRCRSPFVGMGFSPREYLNFLEHMQEAGALEVTAVSSEERNYPIIQTRHARLFGLHLALT